MAGSITLALQTAKNGLLTHRGAITATANNIANVNTPNYSRKIVNLEAQSVDGNGAGVRIASITRNVDEGLLKSLRDALSEFHTSDIQTSYFDRLQNLFGRPGDNNSISHMVQEFTDSVEQLALSPERAVEQQSVVRRGKELAVDLQGMIKTITELRIQADKQIANLADRVSVLTKEIEEMNVKIVRNGTLNHDVTDLRDRRDAAVDELATILDVRYYHRSDDEMVLFTANGHVLVDSQARPFSHDPANGMTTTVSYEEGQIPGIFAGNTDVANDITQDIEDGKLRGLIEMRDNTLPALAHMLDEMAAGLIQGFNQVHNRGASYPGYDSMEGTREFIAPDSQTIEISEGDVSFAILDNRGNQVSQVKLSTLLPAPAGPTTITDLADTLQTWLRGTANGGPDFANAQVGVNSDGRLFIELNEENTQFVIRDEADTPAGSAAADAAVRFDSDGDGVFDEEVRGFSYFFGLNDFFVADVVPSRFESDAKSDNFIWQVANGPVTLTFQEPNNQPPAPPPFTTTSESITFQPGNYRLEDIVEAINDTNNNLTSVSAAVVQDGNSVRLRIINDAGQAMTVTDDAPFNETDSFMSQLGMHASKLRTAEFLDVRDDIFDAPNKMSRGKLNWDASLGVAGEYVMTAGDNSVVRDLAEFLNSPYQFDKVGELSDMNVDFIDYAAAIVSIEAARAQENTLAQEADQVLTDSLEEKSNNVRGVSLDEELSYLTIVQQAYSGSAKAFSTIRDMINELLQIV